MLFNIVFHYLLKLDRSIIKIMIETALSFFEIAMMVHVDILLFFDEAEINLLSSDKKLHWNNRPLMHTLFPFFPIPLVHKTCGDRLRQRISPSAGV